MFQFPGFAFIPYVFRNKYLLLISASPKIAEPELGRRPASAHPECASRSTSSGRLFGITEIEGGFPHSEILGSKPVRGSPGLIAAYHVLHRLSAPRHPPDTLKTLDCSHCQRAPCGSARNKRSCDRSSHDFAPSTRQSTDPPPRARLQDGVGLFEKTSFASNASGSSSGQA